MIADISFSIFFFNDTATTEIYTLSLHDALPISSLLSRNRDASPYRPPLLRARIDSPRDRKSTRLNSSHSQISYAVFCLKKKKIIQYDYDRKTLSARQHAAKWHTTLARVLATVRL